MRVRSRWFSVLLAFVLCVGGATVARSADYHVSQNQASASDANAGTSEALPWKTL